MKYINIVIHNIYIICTKRCVVHIVVVSSDLYGCRKTMSIVCMQYGHAEQLLHRM